MASQYVYCSDVLVPAICFFEYLNSEFWGDGYVEAFLRHVETGRCRHVRDDDVPVRRERRPRLSQAPLARAYVGLIRSCAILELRRQCDWSVGTLRYRPTELFVPLDHEAKLKITFIARMPTP